MKSPYGCAGFRRLFFFGRGGWTAQLRRAIIVRILRKAISIWGGLPK
jgi:hypothetical protein